MKKYKKLLTTIIICVCVFSFIEVIDVSNGLNQVFAATKYEKILSSYKDKDYANVIRLCKSLPKKSNEKLSRKLTSKMKKAYLKKVKSFRTYSNKAGKPYAWDYFLTDIDKNGKAELLIRYGTCEADVRLLVYTWKNGKIKKVGTTTAFHARFYYYPKNGIVIQQGHMSQESVILVTMKNGKLKTESIGGRYPTTYDELRRFNYISFPYELKSHMHWPKNGSCYFDFKELK